MLLYSQYGPAAQGYMSDLVKTMITALSLPGTNLSRLKCNASFTFQVVPALEAACSEGGPFWGQAVST